MPSFLVKPEWIGSPEVPFESRFCPYCESLNWVAGIDLTGMGNFETEAVQCWHCKEYFWLDGYDPDTVDDPGDAIVCVGVPDPAIPLNTLYDLVDAAEQNLGDIRSFYAAHPNVNNDPTLIRVIESLESSIKYVHNLIFEDKNEVS